MTNKNDNKEVHKTEDELWDELMDAPESAIFFEELNRQAEEGLANKSLIKDDFDEDK